MDHATVTINSLLNVLPGSEIIVPVALDNSSGRDISALDLVLQYDQSLLEPLTPPISNGELTQAWDDPVSRIEPGELRLSLSSAWPLELNVGNLINLHFRIKPNASGIAQINLDEQHSQIMEGEIQLIAETGEINISTQSNEDEENRVEIHGPFIANQILSARAILLNESRSSTVEYQWYADGNVIPEATNQHFKISIDQIGKRLSVVASYLDKNGEEQLINSTHTSKIISQEIEPLTRASIKKASLPYQANKLLNLPVQWTSNIIQSENNQPPLNAEVFFNDSFIGYKSIDSTDSDRTPTVEIKPDTNDLDQNPQTNSILSISWPEIASPNEASQPRIIIEFESTNQEIDSINGESSINLRTIPREGSELTGNIDTITMQPDGFHLDVDGDGRISAFSDGLMIIRKLLGPAFAGAALTENAVGTNATRTTEEIHQFIEHGIRSKALDVDGSGLVGTFTDGLLIIRSMLPDFEEDKLVDKALSSQSPYFNHENASRYIHQNIEAIAPSLQIQEENL